MDNARCLMSVFVMLASVCCLGMAARAEVIQIPVHSGTGFFIGSEYAVTNEHVVHGCTRVQLRMNGVDWAIAKVIATDAVNDLALLESPKTPMQRAALRKDIDNLKPGDRLMAIGYPLGNLAAGRFEIAPAELVNLHDSGGNSNLLQFSDVTKQGYSGGPLLDESGQVVGVIRAQVTLYETTLVDGREVTPKHISHNGEAINLATLEDFLAGEGINFLALDSGAALESAKLEKLAEDFTVNVQCAYQE